MQRRYADPKGYESYERVVKTIASQVVAGYQVPWNLLITDFVAANATAVSTQVAQAQAPVYWLSPPLLESFLHTDLPNWICGIQRVIHLGVLMLPQSLMRSPDGEAISYIAFRHTKAFEEPPEIKYNERSVRIEPKNFDNIVWTTTTASGVIYASSTNLRMNEEGEGELDSGNNHFETFTNFGIEVDRSAEDKFLYTVSSVLLQTLLLMQIRPELVTASSQLQASPGLGFNQAAKEKRSASQLWTPNWIGKEYAAPKHNSTTTTKTGTGTHASPRPHWRRGHFRRVVVGKRDQNQREWRWFEPIRVNDGE